MVEKKTALTDTARMILQDKLDIMVAESQLYPLLSKRWSIDVIASYDDCQTRLSQSEKEHPPFDVEKRKFPSRTDDLETAITTFDRSLSNLQYNYDRAFAREKETSLTLTQPLTSVQDALRIAQLSIKIVPTYIDWLKTDPRESLALLLPQLRDATKYFVKQHDYAIAKSGDVKLSVVDEMLQAIETDLRDLG